MAGAVIPGRKLSLVCVLVGGGMKSSFREYIDFELCVGYPSENVWKASWPVSLEFRK